MSQKHLFILAVTCLGLLLAAIPLRAAQLDAAIAQAERLQTIGSQAYANARAMRQCTTRTCVDELAHDLSAHTQAASQACRLLDEALTQPADDPRRDLSEARLTCTQIDANARFAGMALRDLLSALDLGDFEARSRALKELEGGFRFIRLAASELLLALREWGRTFP